MPEPVMPEPIAPKMSSAAADVAVAPDAVEPAPALSSMISSAMISSATGEALRVPCPQRRGSPLTIPCSRNWNGPRPNRSARSSRPTSKPQKSKKGHGLLVAALLVGLAGGGFYAAWMYAPGFRGLVQVQLGQVMALAGTANQLMGSGAHPQTASRPPVKAATPQTPPAAPRASASSTGPVSADPSSAARPAAESIAAPTAAATAAPENWRARTTLSFSRPRARKGAWFIACNRSIRRKSAPREWKGRSSSRRWSTKAARWRECAWLRGIPPWPSPPSPRSSSGATNRISGTEKPSRSRPLSWWMFRSPGAIAGAAFIAPLPT